MPAGVHKEKRVTKETQKQQRKKSSGAARRSTSMEEVGEGREESLRSVLADTCAWGYRCCAPPIHPFPLFFFLFMIRLVFFFTNDDECMCWRVWACSFV